MFKAFILFTIIKISLSIETTWRTLNTVQSECPEISKPTCPDCASWNGDWAIMITGGPSTSKITIKELKLSLHSGTNVRYISLLQPQKFQTLCKDCIINFTFRVDDLDQPVDYLTTNIIFDFHDDQKSLSMVLSTPKYLVYHRIPIESTFNNNVTFVPCVQDQVNDDPSIIPRQELTKLINKHNTLSNECQPNEFLYKNGTEYSCNDCKESGCRTCNTELYNQRYSQCITCEEGQVFDDKLQCKSNDTSPIVVERCEDDICFTIQDISNQNSTCDGYSKYERECIPCKGKCKTCSSEETCITCNSDLGLYMDTADLECKCAQGSFWNEEDQKCVTCSDSCSTCSNEVKKDLCSSCNPSNYWSDLNETCKGCLCLDDLTLGDFVDCTELDAFNTYSEEDKLNIFECKFNIIFTNDAISLPDFIKSFNDLVNNVTCSTDECSIKVDYYKNGLKAYNSLMNITDAINNLEYPSDPEKQQQWAVISDSFNRDVKNLNKISSNLSFEQITEKSKNILNYLVNAMKILLNSGTRRLLISQDNFDKKMINSMAQTISGMMEVFAKEIKKSKENSPTIPKELLDLAAEYIGVANTLFDKCKSNLCENISTSSFSIKTIDMEEPSTTIGMGSNLVLPKSLEGSTITYVLFSQDYFTLIGENPDNYGDFMFNLKLINKEGKKITDADLMDNPISVTITTQTAKEYNRCVYYDFEKSIWVEDKINTVEEENKVTCQLYQLKEFAITHIPSEMNMTMIIIIVVIAITLVGSLAIFFYLYQKKKNGENSQVEVADSSSRNDINI